MNNLAERDGVFLQPEAGDPAFKARLEMLRAAIQAIPKDQRAAAFTGTCDLWPAEIFRQPKLPQRGGDVLNNVVRIFKRDPEAIRDAAEVQTALVETGVNPEPQAVRNALSYLSGRSVLRRVGYGKYQLDDGRIIDGLP